MTEKHVEDVRNIQENDHVTIETSEGHDLTLQCIDYNRRSARDPNVVEEYRTWTFTGLEYDEIKLQITDGLARFPDQEFPYHSALWCPGERKSLGYVEDLEIHAEMTA